MWRRVLHTLVTVVWGLWFGGLVVLFIAISSLFSTFSSQHEVAGKAAANIFRVFNAYQLGLAAAALLGTFVWRIVGSPRLKTTLFTLFALATVAACVNTMYFAPKIEGLQAQGLARSAEFGKLHAASMMTYIGETVFVLLAGLFLPSIPRKE